LIIDPWSYNRIPAHRDAADRVLADAGIDNADVTEVWVAEGMACIRRIRVRERTAKVVTFALDANDEPSYYLTVKTASGWVNIADEGQMGETLNDPSDLNPLLQAIGIEFGRRRRWTLKDAELDIAHPPRKLF
jgi:hypothetical protein